MSRFPHLTETTVEQLVEEARALDEAYARAAEFDAAHAEEPPEEWEDEDELLRKAALNRGQP
jgi:hypothetical protein